MELFDLSDPDNRRTAQTQELGGMSFRSMCRQSSRAPDGFCCVYPK